MQTIGRVQADSQATTQSVPPAAVELIDLTVTPEVAPGEQVGLSFDFAIDRQTLIDNGWGSGVPDPDFCIASGIQDGVKLHLDVYQGDTASPFDSRDVCQPVDSSFVRTFEWVAPTTPGEYTVTVIARSQTSSETVAADSITYTVRESGGGGGAGDPIKGGNLFIGGIQGTNHVQPGSDFDVVVEVDNGALAISANDVDNCENAISPCEPPSGLSGYCYNVEVNPTWSMGQTSTNGCVQIALLGVGSETKAFTLTAPETPGDYNFDVTLTALGSGAKQTKTFVVTVDEPTGGGGGGGGGGNGNPPPGTTLNQWWIAGAGIAAGVGLIYYGSRKQ